MPLVLEEQGFGIVLTGSFNLFPYEVFDSSFALVTFLVDHQFFHRFSVDQCH